MSEATRPSSAGKGLPANAVVAEEWGVHYSPETSDPSKAIRSMGTGYWAKVHAEQEVERTIHNGRLASVGQPKTAVVVHRTVTTYRHESEWASVITPGDPDEGRNDEHLHGARVLRPGATAGGEGK